MENILKFNKNYNEIEIFHAIEDFYKWSWKNGSLNDICIILVLDCVKFMLTPKLI